MDGIQTLSGPGFFQKLGINLPHQEIPLNHLVLVVALGFQIDQMKKETKRNKVNIWKFSSATRLLCDLE